ncbi:mitophagy protein ATG32 Ecym_4021 [Eremothecium cymbalariae DBVPG|uniref:Autophagy-related protein 32 n=1 Tax=Eremothecium cymbalariae (strain CBS 270.75 / DBVPG 7215 / KCTC 17166 / NRRL Y-17582) TaxID=931890 RepID=G8JSV1_ERECY|nr:hypothetical protein Ecym_4021 [Eremothecium cymbalariae DBVPG\
MSQTVEKMQSNGHTQNGGLPGTTQRSILDPHLSVLEILEGKELNKVEGPHELSGASRVSGKQFEGERVLHHSISESWQSIKSTDYLFLSRANDTSLQQQSAVGILSSSDTSEEEQDIHPSPPPPNSASSAFDSRIINIAGQAFSATLSHLRSEDEDDDGETVTVSLPNTMTSLVMPKLSLSDRIIESKVLIVGQPARKFWFSIPKSYQKMFEICSLSVLRDKDVDEKYSTIMVIFHDMGLAPELLDRICNKVVRPRIIPICQKGQKQHLSSLLKQYVSGNRIKLFCNPIVMSNHHEKHRLLKHLHQLSSGSDSGYETEVTVEPVKKLPRKAKKRPSKPSTFRDWVVWTASITIGIGIGCCVSLMVSTRYAFLVPRQLAVDDITSSPLSPEGTDKSSHNLFLHAYSLCKTSLKKLASSLRPFFSDRLESCTWIHTLGIELSYDDSLISMGRIMPLDFIML